MLTLRGRLQDIELEPMAKRKMKALRRLKPDCRSCRRIFKGEGGDEYKVTNWSGGSDRGDLPRLCASSGGGLQRRSSEPRSPELPHRATPPHKLYMQLGRAGNDWGDCQGHHIFATIHLTL